MSRLDVARRRLTKKQRQKVKRQQEADHKRFMRRGALGAANTGARPVHAGESPRQRHEREQRERDAARRAEREAEHVVVSGKRWAVVVACVGQEMRLLRELRKADIPYLRAQDDVVQVLPSGFVRKLRVPIRPRTVFVGVDDRDHLERLARAHPWLMERIPGQRHGRLEPGERYGIARCFDDIDIGQPLPDVPPETVPWMVAQVERMSSDCEGGSVTALVSDAEMRRFADCLVDASPLAAGECPFEIGELIEVVEGPFASFPGNVEEIDMDRQRLNVAVSVFGRATPVELEFRQVRRA